MTTVDNPTSAEYLSTTRRHASLCSALSLDLVDECVDRRYNYSNYSLQPVSLLDHGVGAERKCERIFRGRRVTLGVRVHKTLDTKKKYVEVFGIERVTRLCIEIHASCQTRWARSGSPNYIIASLPGHLKTTA